MNPIVSVVMPIYNAERFLRKTIPSVLNQTFTSIELILVNDGSTDNSLELCRKYADQDSRVKILDMNNGGANPARGRGVESAIGKYVYFMDADDTIAAQEIQTLYDEIEDADVLMSGCRCELLLNRSEYISALINHQIPLRLCGHMYRRSILNTLFFNTPKDIKMGEDMLSNLMIAEHVKLFKSIRYTGYHIDISNVNSVSRGFVRTLAYEKKFDNLLTSILSSFINPNKVNLILARQRFESLKYLIVEDKNIDLSDEFTKNLFLSAKFLPTSKYWLEKIIMNLRPIEISAFLLRGLILFKRKFL